MTRNFMIKPLRCGIKATVDELVAVWEAEGRRTYDLRGAITRRRAKAIAEADARGEPRPPLDWVVREFDRIDRQRLRGAE